jgi:hypothetical protein
MGNATLKQWVAVLEDELDPLKKKLGHSRRRGGIGSTGHSRESPRMRKR